MASKKFLPKDFEQELKNNKLGSLYIFHGVEAYLRNYYLNLLKQKLVQPGFEGFNYTLLEGSGVTFDALSDAVFSYPMMADKKLVVLRDFDIMKPPAAMKDKIPELIANLPEETCLVCVYDTIKFDEDKKSDISDAVHNRGKIVEFAVSGNAELVRWIIRHFKALKKEITAADAEYLIFNSGALMETLQNEIVKIASYAKGSRVERSDIDAVATKILEAKIYELTGFISDGRPGKALSVLRDLVWMKFDPIMLSGAVSKQMLRLCSAKAAVVERKRPEELMKLWGMKSAYPAQKLMKQSENFNRKALVRSLELCAETDIRLKSSYGDRQLLLEMLVLSISALQRGAAV